MKTIPKNAVDVMRCYKCGRAITKMQGTVSPIHGKYHWLCTECNRRFSR